MKISPDNPMLTRISITDFVAHLERIGWTRLPLENRRLIIFREPTKERENPIELALPTNWQYRDALPLLANAVNLLADIQEKKTTEVILEVRSQRRDIMQIRILSGDAEDGFLNLEYATAIINNIENLIAYGACSEEKAEPYITRKMKIGKDALEQYELAQTVQGSYGFVIETPLPKSSQQTFLTPQKPLNRRVMERIFFGLLSTHRAFVNTSAEEITENFLTGFNANMCRAVAMIQKGVSVEYTIYWSPLFPLPENIVATEVITLEKGTDQILIDAARSLEKVEPREVTIRGRIIRLASEADKPVEMDWEERVITVEWNDRETGQVFRVRVQLNATEYKDALNAHAFGNTVSISGTLIKSGTTWKLLNPHGFRVE